MTVYKTLNGGIQIVEYDERFAAGLADMVNRSRENWGGGSELATEQSTIDIYRNSSFINVYLATQTHNKPENKAEVIGICSVAKYYKDADALYIQYLNVRPDYHGKSIGKELTLMAVERTIALGCPRLELHTWPGNVKAVPLYKKCGFMWEDNSETTHLSNFIPTVLGQELIKPFFADACWYKDSARSLEIKPDGIIRDNFEFFTYKWAKDGKNLSVTFEKFGRRICRVETDDFAVELKADNHELAYGFDYKAKFFVENKSGKPLNFTFDGLDDGCVSFSCQKGMEVADITSIESDFTVNEPPHRQDPYRKHPCVLASVKINGMALEMGLGIDAKPPLSAEFHSERVAAFAGQKFDAHLSFTSALPEDASISLTLPSSEYIRFGKSEHTFDIPALGKFSIEDLAETLKTGYIGIPAVYSITLQGGRKARFEKKLDIVNHGLCGGFSADTEKSYSIVSGAYCLSVNKNSNYATLCHALDYELDLEFPISKLGKPYDDEFGLAKPAEVKFCERGAEMVMELTYHSTIWENIVMTVIFTLTASGIVTRRHCITNAGSTERKIYLNETVYTGVNHNSTFKYNGRFTASPRYISGDSFDSAEASLLEENWIFTESKPFTAGVCWASPLKPSFRWNDGIVLEHELTIPPGASTETPPVTACIGLFGDYQAFRNFALGTYSPHTEPTVEPLELIVNSHNPIFSGDALIVCLKNNRSIVYEGEMELAPMFYDPVFWDETQTNSDELVEENVFTVELNKPALDGRGIFGAKLRTGFPIFKSETSRVLFSPNGEVRREEKDGIFTVSNALLTYKCDPSYYAGIFSLTDKNENEWLLSKYPKIEPYEWWNPFIGGMRAGFDKINPGNMLKETAFAGFTQANDCFGNTWKGIKTWVTIAHNKELKGLTFESFYLTMPGIPVLCGFTRYRNNTGAYLKFDTSEVIFGSNGTDEDDLLCDIYDKGKSRTFVAGNASLEYLPYEFARVRGLEGVRLHILPNSADRRCTSYIDDDTSALIHSNDYYIGIANGKMFQTRPTFQIFANSDLSRDELSNLERVVFDENN